MMKEFEPGKPQTPSLKARRRVQYSSDLRSRVISGFHRVRPIHLISSILQIFFGFTMVGLALLGLVYPIWIAAVVNIFGCLLAVIGGYQLYDCITNSAGRSNLVKDSIRNVIDFRN